MSRLTAHDIIQKCRVTLGSVQAHDRKDGALISEALEAIQAFEQQPMSSFAYGAGLIAAERQRQVEKEDYDPEHDDQHPDGSIAVAGAAYALSPDAEAAPADLGSFLWPWGQDFFKPKGRIANLVRAGALIAAEIDRLARKAIDQGESAVTWEEFKLPELGQPRVLVTDPNSPVRRMEPYRLEPAELKAFGFPCIFQIDGATFTATIEKAMPFMPVEGVFLCVDNSTDYRKVVHVEYHHEKGLRVYLEASEGDTPEVFFERSWLIK